MADETVQNIGVSVAQLRHEITSGVDSRSKVLEVNELNLSSERMKIERIIKLIEDARTDCCKIWNEHLRSQSEERLEEFKRMLTICEEELNKLSDLQNQKCFSLSRCTCTRASNDNTKLSNIHEKLCDIDRDCEMCHKRVKVAIADRTSSTLTTSEIDYPTPYAVTDFEVYPQREYIIVSWTDKKNRCVGYYNILVSKENVAGEGLTIKCEPILYSTDYKQNLGQRFDAWCTYFVRACAVNEVGISGPTTNPKAVYMNQYPPHVKPSGLRTLCGSNTSVKIRVNRPDMYDDFCINKCRLSGKMRSKNTYGEWTSSLFETDIACIFSEKHKKQEIEISETRGDLNPDTQYSLKLCFCNKWGMDMTYASDELPPFMISAIPSTPVISFTETARDSTTVTVLLTFNTDQNAGSVSSYMLHMKVGRRGEWYGELVEEDCAECKLKRRTTYHFYAISLSLGGKISDKSNELEITT